MLVVAAGLLLAGCCRSNKVSISQDVDMTIPIELGVRSTNSKGMINNLYDMVSECYAAGANGARLLDKGFGVYGYKTVAGKTTYPPLFNDTRVYPEHDERPASTDDTSWKYQPLRHWDLTASYQFLAYWPYLPDGTNLTTEDKANVPYVSVPVPADADAVTENERVLTIHNIPNWQRANTDDNPDDYMTATSSGSYQANYASENGVVHLTFEHLLSQLVLQGYYVGIKENEVTIKSIKLNGVRIPVSNGKSSYAKPFEEQEAPSFDISKDDDVEHTLYTPESPGTGMLLSQDTYYTDAGKNKDGGDDPITQSICRWLVVPSTGWGNVSLDIQYSVKYSAVSTSTFRSIVSGISLNSNDGTNERPGEMLPGKTYILTLKFDSSGGGIDVKAVWVNGWQQAPNPVNHIVYNW